MKIGDNDYNLILSDDSFYEIIYIFFLSKSCINISVDYKPHEIFQCYNDEFGLYLGLKEAIGLLDLLDIIESPCCDSSTYK